MDMLKDELDGLELGVFEIEDVADADGTLGYCHGGCAACSICSGTYMCGYCYCGGSTCSGPSCSCS